MTTSPINPCRTIARAVSARNCFLRCPQTDLLSSTRVGCGRGFADSAPATPLLLQTLYLYSSFPQFGGDEGSVCRPQFGWLKWSCLPISVMEGPYHFGPLDSSPHSSRGNNDPGSG